MNDPFLERVIQMAKVVRPVEQPSPGDWVALERDIGLALPSDLKQLVTELGSGHFGERWMFNPGASSKYTNFTRDQLFLFREAVGPIVKEAALPLYPESGGFIQVGFSGNRMDLLLRPGSSPETPYTLAWLEQDYYIAHRLEMTVSRFLHDLYLGKIEQEWALTARDLVWGKNEAFFLPPDQFDFSGYD